VITGPDEGAGAVRGHLRAAHADREQTIDVLKTAFVAGRLTKDELDARAGCALAARTYADLAALTDDLPADGPPRQSNRPRNRPRRAHPVRNAAVGSAGCLTVGFLSFWYGASLDDHNTLIFLYLTLLALITAAGVMGCGIVVAVRARRSRGQLPPRPGPAVQIPERRQLGRTGDDPSPSSTHTVEINADHRRRPALSRRRIICLP
jgi:hypothetical protein